MYNTIILEHAMKHRSTKINIMRKCIPIFSENGYHSTTIRQISKTLGVNIAAINYYFGGKDQLYSCILKSIACTTWEKLNKYCIEKSNNHQYDAVEAVVSFLHGIQEISNQDKMDYSIKLCVLEQISPSPHYNILYENLIQKAITHLANRINFLFANEYSQEFIIQTAQSCVVSALLYKTQRHTLSKFFNYAAETDNKTHNQFLRNFINQISNGNIKNSTTKEKIVIPLQNSFS